MKALILEKLAKTKSECEIWWDCPSLNSGRWAEQALYKARIFGMSNGYIKRLKVFTSTASEFAITTRKTADCIHRVHADLQQVAG